MCIIHWGSVTFICCYKDILLLKNKQSQKGFFYQVTVFKKSSYPHVLWNSYLSSVDAIKLSIYVACYHLEISCLGFFRKILKTPATLGSVLWKREWKVLRLLPTFIQLRMWPLFLALMSMHKNAASSSAQSPVCFADLYIYVDFVPTYCCRNS